MEVLSGPFPIFQMGPGNEARSMAGAHCKSAKGSQHSLSVTTKTTQCNIYSNSVTSKQIIGQLRTMELGTIKARPRSAVRASNHAQYAVNRKYGGCLDSKSRENWPIAFAIRHPIPILAV